MDRLITMYVHLLTLVLPSAAGRWTSHTAAALAPLSLTAGGFCCTLREDKW